MKYIAAPAYDPNVEIVMDRFNKLAKFASFCFANGDPVISAVLYKHSINHEGLPIDRAVWKSFCEELISKCTALIVLMLDGWDKSPGVLSEIEFAKKLNIEVIYETYPV